MKRNKLLATFSLTLVATLGTVACAPSEVTPEEGKKVFQNIQQIYKNKEIEVPNTVSVDRTNTYIMTDGGKNRTKTTSDEASYDLDNLKAYVHTIDGDIDVKSWTYYQDGKLINAIEQTDSKIYTEITMSKDQALSSIKNEVVIKTIFEPYTDDYLAASELCIDNVSNFVNGDILLGLPMGAKCTASWEFRADDKGNFQFSGSGDASGEEDGTITTTVISAAIEFENYLPKNLTYTFKEGSTNPNGEVHEVGNIFTSHMSKTSNITLPDLSTFTKTDI